MTSDSNSTARPASAAQVSSAEFLGADDSTAHTTERASAETLDISSLSAAVECLRGRRFAVLTGAGVSTDSGIPDYRGTGSSPRAAMTLRAFLTSEQARRHYWVVSHLGWHPFRAAEPNSGHRAITALEASGKVPGVITQNIDGLHVRAGNEFVVELHGSLDRVWCLSCHHEYTRSEIAVWLEELNPRLAAAQSTPALPDGTVEVDTSVRTLIDGLTVPECRKCGGILKPGVVFFGETVPIDVYRWAERVLESADVLLVAGSSLAVNSGMQLVERAIRRRQRVVIINRGPTRADHRATVRIEGGTTESLVALAGALIPAGSAKLD